MIGDVAGVVWQFLGSAEFVALSGVALFLVFELVRPGLASTVTSYSGAAPRRVMAVGAAFAVIVWGFGAVAERRWIEPWGAAWWRYAAPIAAAAIAVGVLAVWSARRRARVEEPVPPIARRTWSSFVELPSVAVFAAACACLVLVSVACGAASRRGPAGYFNVIDVVGSNGGLSSFYGWAYAGPAVLAVAVLVASCVATLHVDARGPYARPQSVAAERAERSGRARALLGLATAAVVLSLGGVFTFLAGTGFGNVGYGLPGGEVVMWSVGFSSLAPAFTVIGWALQSVAIALLLVIARPRRGELPAPRVGHPVGDDVSVTP